KPGQVDALGVDVVMPTSLLDGPQDVFLYRRVVAVLAAPAKRGSAVGTKANGMRPSQGDANVVAPAQARRQTQDLFFTPARAMQEDHQRNGIVRLVAGGQERAQWQPTGSVNLRLVKPFERACRPPEQIGMRHGSSDNVESANSAEDNGRKP